MTCMLQSKCNSLQAELVRQTLLVRGLQQPRAKLAVNLDRTSNHPVRQLVEFHTSCSSCPSWSPSPAPRLPLVPKLGNEGQTWMSFDSPGDQPIGFTALFGDEPDHKSC